MENTTTYLDATLLLSKQDLIAPAYFILGGIQEGCVITRSQFNLIDIWNLNSKSSNWFLYQTNYGKILF